MCGMLWVWYLLYEDPRTSLWLSLISWPFSFLLRSGKSMEALQSSSLSQNFCISPRFLFFCPLVREDWVCSTPQPCPFSILGAVPLRVCPLSLCCKLWALQPTGLKLSPCSWSNWNRIEATKEKQDTEQRIPIK